MTDKKQIILFDGVCNFCNFWVNFVIERDSKDIFKFASLQSSIARELTQKLNFDSSSLDTFVLIADDKLYTKSTAALLVSKELKSPVKLIYSLIIFPKFLRDIFYDLIAKHRYKIFGKRDVCYIPSNNVNKFLE
ncbi:MAG: DCC1-like thiol-disulfide oxidoreductase family protein [Ignavibacteriaceae bacterium]|nr:DCC1-like thiol-disulfide oxidoreductase family protein [Ignavibacteriaceae bacterium]MCU0406029.1 DCC1-like thiol-disulfide oxidoreductase family protein [Ignavibacteriaceae bacterium]MCU0413702.1 DCC1-like thiol-disulfide oxidoreductase family protein [Ignavibacteriaceae bacterium]